MTLGDSKPSDSAPDPQSALETLRRAAFLSRRIPPPALVLGLAGVVPFAACAIGLWVLEPQQATRALFAMIGYGAVILSFLGGVHWGRVMLVNSGWTDYLYAVTPSLAAWIALLIQHDHADVGLLLLLISFLAAFMVDRRLVTVGQFPAWFGRLRLLLSSLVALCLVAALTKIAVSS